MSNAAHGLTIAVITDLHAAGESPSAARRGDIVDILLLRAVKRCNRWIRPDVVLVLGDVLDNGTSPAALERMSTLKGVLKQLACPWIAIPGNHDPDPDTFYSVFPRPDPVMDIAGARFLSFLDREEPGCNASRGAQDIDRPRLAREGYSGPLISLQHVPLGPAGWGDSPFGYTNADEIIDAMHRAGVALSVSGHFHAGTSPQECRGMTCVAAPAVCEKPFAFLLIRMRNGKVSVERQRLAMTDTPGLVDCHVHTQLAYCSENMSVARSIDLAESFGLDGIVFAEHSAHLYFARESCWSDSPFNPGIEMAVADESRVADYRQLHADHGRPHVRFGLEVDCDARGCIVLRDEDRAWPDLLLGSIHSLAAASGPDGSIETAKREFMGLLETLLDEGMAVLAHPFRAFRRGGLTVPQDLFGPVARLLQRHATAAEINFHPQETPAAFIAACLEEGVRMTLGSDAHNLYEVGEFTPHLRVLRDAGFTGDLSNILMPVDKE